MAAAASPITRAWPCRQMAFRGFIVLLLLAVLVAGLVILNEGIHRVFGL